MSASKAIHNCKVFVLLFVPQTSMPQSVQVVQSSVHPATSLALLAMPLEPTLALAVHRATSLTTIAPALINRPIRKHDSGVFF